MSNMPKSVHINEEGPREGFQIESADIPTDRKVALIDMLSETGVKHIQIVSFVNPKAVPGMADADQVVQQFKPKEGVHYTGMWLNDRGFERALTHSNRLYIEGALNLYASNAFLKRNQNRDPEQQLTAQHDLIKMYQSRGIPVRRAFVTAAFGCNFEGDVPVERVVSLVGQIRGIAAEHGESVERVGLGDTMGWASPLSIKRVVSAIRDKYPDQSLVLHLHDTRGLGLANAYAGLEMGISIFDSAVAGLGGCPFAGHKGAAGNVCTEDLVFMCEEMGIETGIDLDKMIECARFAEEVVGHPLPGSVMRGGSLRRFREARRSA
jgi:hydroxymethylglutaryl-CoA lyase